MITRRQLLTCLVGIPVLGNLFREWSESSSTCRSASLEMPPAEKDWDRIRSGRRCEIWVGPSHPPPLQVKAGESDCWQMYKNRLCIQGRPCKKVYDLFQLGGDARIVLWADASSDLVVEAVCTDFHLVIYDDGEGKELFGWNTEWKVKGT